MGIGMFEREMAKLRRLARERKEAEKKIDELIKEGLMLEANIFECNALRAYGEMREITDKILNRLDKTKYIELAKSKLRRLAGEIADEVLKIFPEDLREEVAIETSVEWFARHIVKEALKELKVW